MIDYQQNFTLAIAKNLSIWIEKARKFSASATVSDLADHAHMLRAAKFGITLAACTPHVTTLFLELFPLIERHRYEQLWLPIVSDLVKITDACLSIQQQHLQFRLSKLLYLNGQYQRAESMAKELLATQTSQTGAVFSGELHRLLCDCLRLQHHNQAALQHAEVAVEKLRLSDAQIEHASALNAKGMVLTNLGEHEDAIQAYKLAYAIEETIGDPVRKVRVQSNWARTNKAQGNYQQALDRYEAILALLEHGGSEVDLISTYINLGGLFHELNRFDEAYAAFIQAKVRLRPELSLIYFELLVETNLGVVTQSLSDHGKAIEHLQRAISGWKKRDDTLILGNSMAHHACSLAALGENQQALLQFEAALALLRKHADNANAKTWIAEFEPEYLALRQRVGETVSRPLPLAATVG